MERERSGTSVQTLVYSRITLGLGANSVEQPRTWDSGMLATLFKHIHITQLALPNDGTRPSASRSRFDTGVARTAHSTVINAGNEFGFTLRRAEP